MQPTLMARFPGRVRREKKPGPEPGSTALAWLAISTTASSKLFLLSPPIGNRGARAEPVLLDGGGLGSFPYLLKTTCLASEWPSAKEKVAKPLWLEAIWSPVPWSG